jgi:uracil-DNA glycosylase family 4
MGLISYDGCDNCPIRKTWPLLHSPKMAFTEPTVPVDINLLCLGEAPGQEEDAVGEQFVGKTGKYLRERIPREWRDKLYFQNAVRCRPTDTQEKNRNPSITEISCCSTYLKEDLLTIRPNAILGVGSIPLSNFWPDLIISKIRGIPFPIQFTDKTSCWYYPTFHPSYVSRLERRDEDGSYTNYAEPVFRNDLRIFFEQVRTKFATRPRIYSPPKQIDYPKSAEEAWKLFQQLEEPYAIDFETFKLRPYMRDALLLTCGCSDGKTTFAFPVMWPGDMNPWGKSFLAKMARTKKKWIAQSSSMELTWMRYITQEHDHIFEDTEILARLNHNRKGLGSLDILSKVYLGFDIKALNPNMDKNRMREYPLPKVLKYNALDAWATVEIFHLLGAELAQKPNQLENYYRSIDTVSSCTDMELKGLDVDISVAEEMQKVLYKQSVEQGRQAKAIPEVRAFEKKESRIFSLTAPDDVAAVLVRYCGVDLEQDHETKHYSTKEEVLTPLLGLHPLVDLTLESRGTEKLLSTYILPILSGEIIAVDGKIHSQYRVVHVSTFRLSSEAPNMQNWPTRRNHEIRRMIKAPPGYVIVKFDYAGLEVRVLCMASRDQNLMNDILDAPKNLGQKDIHWYWLKRILQLYPKYMDRLADKTGEKEEQAILDGGRTIIKTDFVFSSFYGSKAGAIANKTLIPVDVLKELHLEFWNRYAATRKWIDGQTRFYQQHGYVQSLTGRMRNEVLPGQEIVNSPIQGTGAEIVLEAQNALHNRAMQEDINFLPRMNVHDDITFFLPDTSDLERYIQVIGADMTMARFPFVTVPLAVECSLGYNWADTEKVSVITGAAYA